MSQRNSLKTYLEAGVIVAPPASVIDAAEKNNEDAVETAVMVKAAQAAQKPVTEADTSRLLLDKLVTVVDIVQSISESQVALANAVIALVERISKTD